LVRFSKPVLDSNRRPEASKYGGHLLLVELSSNNASKENERS
jgi:hypothetical protein